MPASEARIRANQANAARSTGPKMLEGKERSRANAVKHGLTGEGIVLSAEDAAEVERLDRSFQAELKPSGAVGRMLVRRMALMAVRMERSVAQESAMLAGRVAQAKADFDEEWPAVDGVEHPDRARMRTLVANQALFNPSKEACLARKYEAAAERCFFRSLKELRQVEVQAKAATPAPAVAPSGPALGSFSPGVTERPAAAAPAVEPARKVALSPSKAVESAPISRPQYDRRLPIDFEIPSNGTLDVPFSIGRVG